MGWHNPDLKKVRCAACGPPAEGESLRESQGMSPDPIGGSAALRESRSRRDPKWVKGAAGEYLLDKFLHREVGGTAKILTDRVIPETKYNIDHLVIASS